MSDTDETVSMFKTVYELMPADEQYQILQSLIAASNGYVKWRLKAWLSREVTPDLLSLLPPEIQLIILRMVDGSSLLKACQVSQAWNNILRSHDQLWKEKSSELGVNINLKPPDITWKLAFSTSKVQLQHIEAGKAFKEKFVNLQNCKKSVKAVDYHNGYLCAVSDEDCINIWQLELNIPVLSFMVVHAVSCIKFKPNYTLVCGHFTGILTSWDLSDMNDYNFQNITTKPLFNGSDRDFSEFSLLKAKFKMHSGPVFSCDFSEDLQLLVSGSADETIKFWCLRTGHLLHTIISVPTHWVLRVILLPVTGSGPLSHALITMTRDSVDKYEWHYSVSSQDCNSVGEPGDLMLKRGDFSSIRHCITVKLNQNNDNFMTPGLQLSSKYIGLVKQDLQEKQANLVVLYIGTFNTYKEIALNFKVRKLLALGNRYALLLTVGKQLYTSTLVVIDIITGDKIGSHVIPHSKMTTPDGAQIVVGDTEWLDGLTGWDKFPVNPVDTVLDTFGCSYSKEPNLPLHPVGLNAIGNDEQHITEGRCDHVQDNCNSHKISSVKNFWKESKNLVLAAGIRDDVGRVFTLWWKKRDEDAKRKVD